MADAPLDVTVRRLKALGHPARLRIAAMLRGGELCVCQMTAILQLAASTVSAHLAELRRGGCVVERKQSRWVHYALSDEGASLLSALDPDTWGDDQIALDAAVVVKLRAIGPEKLCRVNLDLGKLGLGTARRRGK